MCSKSSQALDLSKNLLQTTHQGERPLVTMGLKYRENIILMNVMLHCWEISRQHPRRKKEEGEGKMDDLPTIFAFLWGILLEA